MFQMLNFSPETRFEDGVATNAEIPKELDIFYRTLDDFLPPGKTFKELTKEEKEVVASRYRFDPYKPGMYQTITGFGKMIN